MFGLIGGAVSAGLGLISSIKNKKKQAQLAQQEAQNRRDYIQYVHDANEGNEGEDATTELNRRRTADAIRQRNAAAAGTAAVIGGTTEAQMAVTDKNNDLIDKTNQTNTEYIAQKHQQNLNRIQQAEGQVYTERQNAIQNQQQQLAAANQQANAAISSGMQGMFTDAEAMLAKKKGK